MRHGICFFAAIALLLSCGPALSAQNAVRLPRTIPCCRAEMQWVIAAARDTAPESINLRVFEDTSPAAKAVLAVNTYERADGTPHAYDIYITLKAVKELSRSELRAVLAHELGHLADHDAHAPGSLESECAADRFAVRLLLNAGANPLALLVALGKMSRNAVFYSRSDVIEINVRIARIKAFLREKGGKQASHRPIHANKPA
ncbi:MAG TPA: M48 family metalloprotease [Candidatus Paceibacterota bacterium]|nr:M48 family metalloprotease [Candidatus Paceibacterota bacterium]